MEKELDGAYEPRRILTMSDTRARDSNSVGQSSVLIKRRSRVQVPAVPPVSDELTDEQLEYVIGGAPRQVFDAWRIKIINEWNLQ